MKDMVNIMNMKNNLINIMKHGEYRDNEKYKVNHSFTSQNSFRLVGLRT